MKFDQLLGKFSVIPTLVYIYVILNRKKSHNTILKTRYSCQYIGGINCVYYKIGGRVTSQGSTGKSSDLTVGLQSVTIND